MSRASLFKAGTVASNPQQFEQLTAATTKEVISPRASLADIILSNVPEEARARAAAMTPPLTIPGREEIIERPTRGVEFLRELNRRASSSGQTIEDQEVLKTIYELANYVTGPAALSPSQALGQEQALRGIALLGHAIRNIAAALPEPPPSVKSDFKTREEQSESRAGTRKMLLGFEMDPAEPTTAKPGVVKKLLNATGVGLGMAVGGVVSGIMVASVFLWNGSIKLAVWSYETTIKAIDWSGRSAFKLCGADPEIFTRGLNRTLGAVAAGCSAAKQGVKNTVQTALELVGSGLEKLKAIPEAWRRLMMTIRNLRYVAVNSNDPAFPAQPPITRAMLITHGSGSTTPLIEYVRSCKGAAKTQASQHLISERHFSSDFADASPKAGETFLTLKVLPGTNHLMLPPGYEVTGIRAIDRKDRAWMPSKGFNAVWTALGGASVTVPLGVSKVTYRIAKSSTLDPKAASKELREILPTFPTHLGIEGEALRDALQLSQASIQVSREVVYSHVANRNFKISHWRYFQKFIKAAGDAKFEAIGGLGCGTEHQLELFLANTFRDFGVPAVYVESATLRGDGKLIDKAKRTPQVIVADETGIFQYSLATGAPPLKGLTDVLPSEERQELLHGLRRLNYKDVYSFSSEVLEAALAGKREKLLNKLLRRKEEVRTEPESFTCWYPASTNREFKPSKFSHSTTSKLPLISALATTRAFLTQSLNAKRSRDFGAFARLMELAPAPPSIEEPQAALPVEALNLLKVSTRAVALKTAIDMLQLQGADYEARNSALEWLRKQFFTATELTKTVQEPGERPPSFTEHGTNRMVGTLSVQVPKRLTVSEHVTLIDRGVFRLLGPADQDQFYASAFLACRNLGAGSSESLALLRRIRDLGESLVRSKVHLSAGGQDVFYLNLLVITENQSRVASTKLEAQQLCAEIASQIEHLGPLKGLRRGVTALFGKHPSYSPNYRDIAMELAVNLGPSVLGIRSKADCGLFCDKVVSKITAEDLSTPHSSMLNDSLVTRTKAAGITPTEYGTSKTIGSHLRKLLVGPDIGLETPYYHAYPNDKNPASQLLVDVLRDQVKSDKKIWINILSHARTLVGHGFLKEVDLSELWPARSDRAVLEKIINDPTVSLSKAFLPHSSPTLYETMLATKPDQLALARLGTILTKTISPHEAFLVRIRDCYPDLWPSFIAALERKAPTYRYGGIETMVELSNPLRVVSSADQYRFTLWTAALTAAGYGERLVAVARELHERIKVLPPPSRTDLTAIFLAADLPSFQDLSQNHGSLDAESIATILCYSHDELGRSVLRTNDQELATTLEWARKIPISEESARLSVVWPALFAHSYSSGSMVEYPHHLVELAREKVGALKALYSDPFAKYIFSRTHQALVHSSTGDLFELTQFQEGDDPRRIDPRSSNRLSRLLVRRNEETEGRNLQIVVDLQMLTEEVCGWNGAVARARHQLRKGEKLNIESVSRQNPDRLPGELIELLTILNLAAQNNVRASVELVWRGHVGSLRDVVKSSTHHRMGEFDASQFLERLNDYLLTTSSLLQTERRYGAALGTDHPIFESTTLPTLPATISLFNFPTGYATDLDSTITRIRKRGGLAGIMRPVREQT